MVESLFDIVKYEYGNFTSKQGCVQWCKSQFLFTSIPRNDYLRYFQGTKWTSKAILLVPGGMNFDPVKCVKEA